MKKHKLSRAVIMLLMVCLCTASVSAAGIVREQDFEVPPDYSQMDAETAVATYLTREMKFNAAAVCGIMANIDYESGFSPMVWGDEGTSYGLCQWHESRCRSLLSFCLDHGYDLDSVYGQMKYLRYELEADYPAVLEYLRSVEDSPDEAYRATWCWCYYYEIPAQRDVQAARRGDWAYQRYIIERD